MWLSYICGFCMLQGLPKTFQGSHLRMKSSTWFDQYMRICLERFSLESGLLPKLCQGSYLRRKSSAWFDQYRRIYLDRFSLGFGLLPKLWTEVKDLFLTDFCSFTGSQTKTKIFETTLNSWSRNITSYFQQDMIFRG